MTTSSRTHIAAKKRIRWIIENALDGIITMDSKGTILEWNPSAEKIFGWSTKEALGQELASLIIPEQLREAHRKGLARFLSSSEHKILGKRIEIKALHKDGSSIITELTVSPHRIGNEYIFNGFVRDITAQKQSNDMIMNIAKGVSAEVGDNFFRSLVTHLASALNADFAFIGRLFNNKKDRIQTIASSADGHIIDDVEYALTNTPCENVLKQGICIYPENIQKLFPEFQLFADLGVNAYAGIRLSNAQDSAVGIMTLLYRRPIHDVKIVESMLNIFAVRASAELDRIRTEEMIRIAQQQLLKQQTRENKQVQLELNSVKEELIQKTRLAAIGQIATTIAHELRNPLGAIRNAIYYLKAHPEIDEHKTLKYLGIIDSEIHNSSSIIENLMEMARPKVSLKKECAIDDIAREAFDILSEKNGAQLKVSCDPNHYVLYADPVQMRQVFINLFTNAIQATDADVTIYFNAARSDVDDIITIRDTGPGIPKHEREKVFDPLYTTKAKGTGLGLTICRQILEQHNATICLMNLPEQDEHANFEICLPRQIDRKIDSELQRSTS